MGQIWCKQYVRVKYAVHGYSSAWLVADCLFCSSCVGSRSSRAGCIHGWWSHGECAGIEAHPIHSQALRSLPGKDGGADENTKQRWGNDVERRETVEILLHVSALYSELFECWCWICILYSDDLPSRPQRIPSRTGRPTDWRCVCGRRPSPLSSSSRFSRIWMWRAAVWRRHAQTRTRDQRRSSKPDKITTTVKLFVGFFLNKYFPKIIKSLYEYTEYWVIVLFCCKGHHMLYMQIILIKYGVYVLK